MALLGGENVERLPPETPLCGYKPPELIIQCPRCRRSAAAPVDKLRRRFGDNVTVGDVARQIAGSRAPQCGLALIDGGARCGVQAFAPAVWTYATLYEALHGGWRAVLHCQRHLAALKRAYPCPEPMELDIRSIAAVLGHDFKLARLPGKCECPKCHSRSLDIQWIVPEPSAPPHAPAADAIVPLRLRPTKAQAGRNKLHIVDGGRSEKP